MNTAALGRDPFMPRPPRVRGPALALALLAHVLLIAGLAFGVHWRNTEPTTVAAELWSAVPQAAAPRAVEPAPVAPVPAKEPPVEARKPEPVVKRAEPVAPPKPQTPALPDPQIAIEKAKRETAKREKQLAADALAQKKAKAADKLKAEKERTEREKTEKAEKAEKA